MKSKMLRILFGFVAILFAQTTLANKISIVDIAGIPIKEGNSANATQFSVTCSSCTISGFLGDPASLSGSQTTGYGLNANPTGELAFLNDLLTDVGKSTVSFVNKIDTAGSSFMTDREYFSVKKAKWTAFFHNTTGGSITLDFDPGNYSHWTEYGEPSVVPLPAAVWLFLSALGAVGFIGRRGKAT